MLRNPKSDITVLLLTFFLTIIFDLTVVLSGVNEKVETVLKRNNFQRIIGEENICNHIDLALARAKEIVGQLTPYTPGCRPAGNPAHDRLPQGW